MVVGTSKTGRTCSQRPTDLSMFFVFSGLAIISRDSMAEGAPYPAAERGVYGHWGPEGVLPHSNKLPQKIRRERIQNAKVADSTLHTENRKEAKCMTGL